MHPTVTLLQAATGTVREDPDGTVSSLRYRLESSPSIKATIEESAEIHEAAATFLRAVGPLAVDPDVRRWIGAKAAQLEEAADALAEGVDGATGAHAIVPRDLAFGWLGIVANADLKARSDTPVTVQFPSEMRITGMPERTTTRRVERDRKGFITGTIDVEQDAAS
jgi:hypothetical protein